MIHVHVKGLSLSNMGFVVLLRGENDPRTLPIFIGGAEAQSIALRLDNVEIALIRMIFSCHPALHMDQLLHLLQLLQPISSTQLKVAL